ncbi:hypothetical protein DAI22_05g126801 [Oryza sativa Japonica Group]|nr:hypothetical protein DAI22_05g126801 [Oryza sativa Japonica Group]
MADPRTPSPPPHGSHPEIQPIPAQPSTHHDLSHRHSPPPNPQASPAGSHAQSPCADQHPPTSGTGWPPHTHRHAAPPNRPQAPFPEAPAAAPTSANTGIGPASSAESDWGPKGERGVDGGKKL